jgi:hypothetical protein
MYFHVSVPTIDILCMTFYDTLGTFWKLQLIFLYRLFLMTNKFRHFFKYRCNVYWCITVFFSRFGIFYLKINFCIQIFRSCLFRWRLSIAIGKAFPCRRDDTNIDMKKWIEFLLTIFIKVLPYCIYLYFLTFIHLRCVLVGRLYLAEEHSFTLNTILAGNNKIY